MTEKPLLAPVTRIVGTTETAFGQFYTGLIGYQSSEPPQRGQIIHAGKQRVRVITVLNQFSVPDRYTRERRYFFARVRPVKQPASFLQPQSVIILPDQIEKFRL